MELAITTKKMNFLTIFLDKMLLKAEGTVDLYTFLKTGLDLFNILHIIMKNIEKSAEEEY